MKIRRCLQLYIFVVVFSWRKNHGNRNVLCYGGVHLAKTPPAASCLASAMLGNFIQVIRNHKQEGVVRSACDLFCFFIDKKINPEIFSRLNPIEI